ncbi:hypothetical protein NQZ68_025809 [Dissostichus eleginoides]|nr:hypothetical protein NQZ68_025809 [Dissostichus eleginoides]
MLSKSKYFPEQVVDHSLVARLQRSDTIRCVKSCQPNDLACVLDPMHSVSHTFISMPTFREFTTPEEIVFLRTSVPAYGGYHLSSYDVKFDILEGNVENAFDIIKRVENGLYVAVIICMGALDVCVFGELSSEWLFETDQGLFLSHQIFGIDFHSLVGCCTPVGELN